LQFSDDGPGDADGHAAGRPLWVHVTLTPWVWMVFGVKVENAFETTSLYFPGR
jgi:hypothetical protein